ncbi:peptidyl-prolyl cis-trans isomerase FKBP13, chloroplastic-like [Gastrolobium bilobum]|uniref:peptidyl-prolyl cis-trans isomerase FKBP13, chloroplastic-like n=1 Tax=Gastrolobium bilobum TaxID=150636 RepID=UPI002AAFB442|nr:peptidyl-prolyl cis-trans isomerase FKBP13, chloroplastic-like [Gastrolobium bilobum]
MKSLAPYSLGTCLTSLQPQKGSNYSSPLPFSAVQVQPLVLLQNETNPTTQFKRRDAIGLSLSFGLLHNFLQSQPTSASAAEAVPCELTVAPSGLAFCDQIVGTGPQALKGQLIKAHYVGKLENGKIFDSSYNRGKPLTFRVGVGEVIKGWDEGILGGDGVPPMLAGGKRTLKLPPELGYGSRGAGCRGGSCAIPPDSVLLFDVEFISKA